MDDQRIFLGLFGVGKYGRYFFEWLVCFSFFFLGRGFWGMDRFHCHATKKYIDNWKPINYYLITGRASRTCKGERRPAPLLFSPCTFSSSALKRNGACMKTRTVPMSLSLFFFCHVFNILVATAK